jgi:hypothetical protein
MSKIETSKSCDPDGRNLQAILEEVSSNELPDLIAALSSDRENVRSAVICLLMDFGGEAADMLIDKLIATDNPYHEIHQEALVRLGGHAVLPLLLSVEKTASQKGNGSDPKSYFREVSRLIKSMPRESVEALADALEQENPTVAYLAAKILHSMGSKSKPSAEKIADSLMTSISLGHDKEVFIMKLEAMNSLGVTSLKAIGALRELLTSRDHASLRSQELTNLALTHLKHAYRQEDFRQEALGALVAMVCHEGDQFDRKEALDALGDLDHLFILPDDNKAVLALIDTANNDDTRISKMVEHFLREKVPEDAVDSFKGLADLLAGVSAKEAGSVLAMLADSA